MWLYFCVCHEIVLSQIRSLAHPINYAPCDKNMISKFHKPACLMLSMLWLQNISQYCDVTDIIPRYWSPGYVLRHGNPNRGSRSKHQRCSDYRYTGYSCQTPVCYTSNTILYPEIRTMHTSYTTYLHLNELFTRLNCSSNWPVTQVLFTKLKRSPDWSVHKPELFTKINCSPDWSVHQNELFTILNCSLDWSVHRNELFTRLKCPPDWSVHQNEVFTRLNCLSNQTVYLIELSNKWCAVHQTEAYTNVNCSSV